jgi:Rieske Fe-S protein
MEQGQEWIRLGSASKVELGVPTLFKARIQRKTGWIVNEEELAIYVRTDNGRDFVAMSNVCTHLGCRVRWISDDDQFFCPCHNAVFDSEGGVVAGPPPRALDRYEVKVEDGQLFVLGG